MFSNKCFSCPCKTKPPRVFPTGDGKAHCPPPQRRNPLRNRKSKEALFPCHLQEKYYLWLPFTARGPEGFQRASGKPFGRLRRGESPCEREKARKLFFLAIHKKGITCVSYLLQGAPKGSRGRAESPLVASAEAKPSAKQKKQDRLFPLPSTRNLFLVGGFVRLRADEVLSHTGKYPKGATGYVFAKGEYVGRKATWLSLSESQPWAAKGCMSRGRPRTPVAKEQCTASLAGARPAGFTSVPGRATVAFKVGFHFVKAKSLRDPRIRLWRKRGLAQLIPPPALWRRIILGV